MSPVRSGRRLYTPAALSSSEIDKRLRKHDPSHWGHSMATMTELIEPILTAARVESIAEIGAYAGDFTEVLLQWAAGAGARVVAIDPLPQADLVSLSEKREDLDLISERSADALRDMELPDAVVIDGDHNYHTVSEELELIGRRVTGAETPLLLLHDVGWPHARRDAYYDPQSIPAEYQERIQEGVGVFPSRPGVTRGGLPYKWAAREEGGPRNGVLTALEDFLAGRAGMRTAFIPIFFGLAVAWHRDAPFAAAVEAVVNPWDRNPVLARLEDNRVINLATQHIARTYLHDAEHLVNRHEALLRDILESESFRIISRLVAIRNRGVPSLRQRIESLLAEDRPEPPAVALGTDL